MAAPCAAPGRFASRARHRRRRGGGFDDADADWPTDVSSSSLTSSLPLAQRRHTFAADGFAALDPSLLDASDARKDGGGGVCCYVVPLHNGQCKDADIIHDFDLRAALAIARSEDAEPEEVVDKDKRGKVPHPSVVSTTTVSLLPREADGGGTDGGGGDGDGDAGGVGDVGGETVNETNVQSLLARLSAPDVDVADVVYLDVGGERRVGSTSHPTI